MRERRIGGKGWKGGMGRTIASVALAMTTVAGAAAQEMKVLQAPGGTIEFMAGDPAIGPTVSKAPYSGEATTTVSQSLADGTRIERTTSTRMFRDSEGRVRREQTVQGLGALNPAGDATIITIVDPVAGVSWVLDPVSRKARRASVRRDFPVARVLRDPLAPPPPPPPPPPPGGGEMRRARGSANLPNAAQPLGTKQMEGVEVTGTRRVEIVPAGQIGNDRPIEITDERWESPALKVLVQSRHSDPRTGIVEYRLTNINRAEPSHDLFVVPPDYVVVDARNEERR